MIEISESTLYPILKRLEAAGMVTTCTREHNGRLRRYYAITRKGEERIDEFLQDMQEFARICEIIRSEDPHD